MNPPRTSKGVVPYNPGLHDLVENKRHWTDARSLDAGWRQRGYLSHRDEIGLSQLVTFRLNKSLPPEKRSEWKCLLNSQNRRDSRKKLEAYLDGGFGACHLKRDDVAGVVENSLRKFHGTRYQLKAWCVMPNHVHVLFRQDISLGKILHSWKSFTANESNKLLNLSDRFWAPDYWDTYMRDEEQEQRTIKYVEENPMNACLARSTHEFKWSSARHRDKYGILTLDD